MLFSFLMCIQRSTGELPLQELIDKYAGAYEVDFVLPSSPESMMSSESNSSDG